MALADFLVDETCLWAVIIVSGVASILCQWLGRLEWYQYKHCENFSEVVTFAWADLFYFVCFTCYAQLCCVYQGNHPGKRKASVVFIVIVVLLVNIAKLWGASLCGTISAGVYVVDYLCIILVLIASLGNCFVVFCGRHTAYLDVHLGTFLTMAITLFVELFLGIFYRGNADAFAGFNYFNAKVGIVVYEIFIDKAGGWTGDGGVLDSIEKFFLFLFFLAAKLGRQLYYYAVFQAGWRENVEIAFIVFAVIEIVCCALMLYYR